MKLRAPGPHVAWPLFVALVFIVGLAFAGAIIFHATRTPVAPAGAEHAGAPE